MCEQCIVDPLYYGEVLPGWFLIQARKDGNIMAAGQWGLLECNDPPVVWDTTPFELSETNAFIIPDDFEEGLYIPAHVGYNLVTAALDVGYNMDEHGRFSVWLFEWLAVHISRTAPSTSV